VTFSKLQLHGGTNQEVRMFTANGPLPKRDKPRGVINNAAKLKGNQHRYVETDIKHMPNTKGVIDYAKA